MTERFKCLATVHGSGRRLRERVTSRILIQIHPAVRICLRTHPARGRGKLGCGLKTLPSLSVLPAPSQRSRERATSRSWTPRHASFERTVDPRGSVRIPSPGWLSTGSSVVAHHTYFVSPPILPLTVAPVEGSTYFEIVSCPGQRSRHHVPQGSGVRCKGQPTCTVLLDFSGCRRNSHSNP